MCCRLNTASGTTKMWETSYIAECRYFGVWGVRYWRNLIIIYHFRGERAHIFTDEVKRNKKMQKWRCHLDSKEQLGPHDSWTQGSGIEWLSVPKGNCLRKAYWSRWQDRFILHCVWQWLCIEFCHMRLCRKNVHQALSFIPLVNYEEYNWKWTTITLATQALPQTWVMKYCWKGDEVDKKKKKRLEQVVVAVSPATSLPQPTDQPLPYLLISLPMEDSEGWVSIQLSHSLLRPTDVQRRYEWEYFNYMSTGMWAKLAPVCLISSPSVLCVCAGRPSA